MRKNLSSYRVGQGQAQVNNNRYQWLGTKSHRWTSYLDADNSKRWEAVEKNKDRRKAKKFKLKKETSLN